ncbi:MAG: hypothetical protein U0P81_09790 [Holophagaceae bacterium]
MSGLVTPCCHAELSAEAFLKAVVGHVPATYSFAGRCPACGEFWEFQVRNGQAVFGYIYAAGSPHFEGMVDVAAGGLCVDGSGADRGLRWGPFRWPLPG